MKERWDMVLKTKSSYITEKYLSKKYKTVVSDENILINSSFVPNLDLIKSINELKPNQAIIHNDLLIAARINKSKIESFDYKDYSNFENINLKSNLLRIENTWDIFKLNGDLIKIDFELLTKGRKSEVISKTNNIICEENIFIEKGAKAEFATLNASNGYIYIGKNAEIMEGSIVRGSLALCEHSVLKLAAKIYGPTTIGPYSKVGGEVNNSVILGYSNKGHDGFLGNSVLGEWCNLGADTNNSNLKNNYAEVKLWNYQKERFTKTGLQFCGLIMGDHSKCGINTMFNTGTVIGVNANIFGTGFPRNFVPSFSWGGAAGFSVYATNKAFEVANKVMKRREKYFDDTEKEILMHIFDETKKYRRFK